MINKRGWEVYWWLSGLSFQAIDNNWVILIKVPPDFLHIAEYNRDVPAFDGDNEAVDGVVCDFPFSLHFLIEMDE